jgi:prophage antirepressor-like protein
MKDLMELQFEGRKIRTLFDENGERMWVAKDVAEALGYSNIHDAISRHCKGVVKHYPLLTEGGMQNVRVIFLPDVSRLLHGCQLDIGVQFNQWLHEEVVPSVHQAGVFFPPKSSYLIRYEHNFGTQSESTSVIHNMWI